MLKLVVNGADVQVDVKANAEAIVGAVRSGSMPCDMQWPNEQIELLQRWIDGGAPQ